MSAHTAWTIGGVVGGLGVAMVVLDRLISWSQTRGSRSYDDPDYRPGSFNPLFEVLDPALKRGREIVAQRDMAGDDAEADGAPPEAGRPPTPAGPTAF
jgi:hypothetical protein